MDSWGAAALDEAAANESDPGSDLCRWSSLDSLTIAGLLVAGALTRLWNLRAPAQIIFDEHFTVSEARCYLHALPYADVHPPFPSWCIALSIRIFGDTSFAWRLPTAILGTGLIAVTYLLGRRMFKSRLSGAFAAGLVLLDGLFLVDSRTALWEIFYVTFVALAYLMLFRFLQDASPRQNRVDLALMGAALGLAMGSKLLIPVVAVVLVSGSILFAAYHTRGVRYSMRETSAIFALFGGLSAFVYLAIFLPNYWFGWWHGVGDQIAYLAREFRYQQTLTVYGGHPYSSRWWSWPLMLRPILYWTKGGFFVATDTTEAGIRALGNPIIWWAAAVAIPLAAVRAAGKKSFPHAFIVVGYMLFMAMWIPIRRYQFVYYYMPALYLGMLALADSLSRCWRGEAGIWEQAAIAASMFPALLFGMGTVAAAAGAIAVAIVHSLLRFRNHKRAAQFVCVLFVSGAIVAFFYFWPIWTGLPMSSTAFHSRMWLHGPGLGDWI